MGPIPFAILVVVMAVVGTIDKAEAGKCSPVGETYGFVYSGTVRTPEGDVKLNQTGQFSIELDALGRGVIDGRGILRFQFPNGDEQTIDEVLSGGDLVENGDGTGTMVFRSNVVPTPRSVAWACADGGEILYFNSTSPGTMATGVATEQ